MEITDVFDSVLATNLWKIQFGLPGMTDRMTTGFSLPATNPNPVNNNNNENHKCIKLKVTIANNLFFTTRCFYRQNI